MLYNWQQSDWPKFQYDLSGVEEILSYICRENRSRKWTIERAGGGRANGNFHRNDGR